MLEGKSLRVNVEKTEGMQLLYSKKANVLKVDPCSVPGEWVGHNAIWCTKCQMCVHDHCSECLGGSAYFLMKTSFSAGHVRVISA